ncbi:Com family DNA-binding transcriptional regulator [Pseudomonas anguilliseptica]|uniref:Com family DNA-binding transcriptional regulator n=1 Tax=Pseudomonas anguilliseptica TaxID=53406 RepID=UPI000B88EE76|nr:Com family DNA-binding transcriptional regulator [Pseudomonas anguilliseptica]
MIDIRCGGCSRLLVRVSGCYTLQVKCPRCRTLNSQTATSCPPERPRASPNMETTRGKTETLVSPATPRHVHCADNNAARLH